MEEEVRRGSNSSLVDVILLQFSNADGLLLRRQIGVLIFLRRAIWLSSILLCRRLSLGFCFCVCER
ncbi:hypothetical protein Hanom_Chr01g00064771 [Helianthus anomalus]